MFLLFLLFYLNAFQRTKFKTALAPIAIACGFIQIYTALAAQTGTIFFAEGFERNFHYDLLRNFRGKINLVTFIGLGNKVFFSQFDLFVKRHPGGFCIKHSKGRSYFRIILTQTQGTLHPDSGFYLTGNPDMIKFPGNRKGKPQWRQEFTVAGINHRHKVRIVGNRLLSSQNQHFIFQINYANFQFLTKGSAFKAFQYIDGAVFVKVKFPETVLNS